MRGNHRLLEDLLADLTLAAHRLDESRVRAHSPVLPHREVNADLVVAELAGPDLVSVGTGFDRQPALKLTRFVQSQGNRRLVVDHLGPRQLEESFQAMPDPERLAHHLVVVAFKVEVEAEHDVECFAVEQADRQQVRGQIEDQLVLAKRIVQCLGIEVPRAKPARLDGQPAMRFVFFFAFQNEVAILPRVEVPQLREIPSSSARRSARPCRGYWAAPSRC